MDVFLFLWIIISDFYSMFYYIFGLEVVFLFCIFSLSIEVRFISFKICFVLIVFLYLLY